MSPNDSRRKHTVLIVEDEKDVANLLSEILSSEGHVTIGAESAKEAIQLAARVEPDVVILDLDLPDRNGIEALRDLRSMGARAEVIILTGHGSQEVARRSMELGALELLTKPFEVEELCAAVKDALDPEYALVGAENRHA